MSSVPSHTTIPSRMAIAVASGMAGLCTRPLASSVVKLIGVARKVARFRLGHVIRHVKHLAVDVVIAAGPERRGASTHARGRDDHRHPEHPAGGQRGHGRTRQRAGGRQEQ